MKNSKSGLERLAMGELECSGRNSEMRSKQRSMFSRLALFALFTPFALAAPDTVSSSTVAYVQRVFPAGAKLSDVAKIMRSGVPLKFDALPVELFAGDAIFIAGSQATINVRYVSTGQVVSVVPTAEIGKAAKPDYIVAAPGVRGLSSRAMRAFMTFWRGVDESEQVDIAMTSKSAALMTNCFNTSGKTNVPQTFQIPSLKAENSTIAGGTRDLFVSWVGGAPPFTVELSLADTGTLLATRSGIRSRCFARLPSVPIDHRRYRLAVIDANDNRLEESNLYGGESVPPLPQALINAEVGEPSRTLYYATWLRAREKGQWAFEALQMIASLDCGSSEVSEWLVAVDGSLAECNEK